jgi:glycosyltransferase involved in cell wall biosynthesis
MNVLHLCTKVPFPSIDGGSMAVMAFIRLLQLKGYSVTILAANTPKHFQAEVPLEAEGVLIRAVPVKTGFSFLRMILNLLFSRAPYNVVRFRNHAFATELKKMITKNKYDVIQFEGSHMGIYLPVIRKYSKAKVILRAHNIEHLLWQDIKCETSSLLKKCYLSVMIARLRNFEKSLIAKTDAVIPLTSRDLNLILELSKAANSCVIPFGIDIAQYHYAKQEMEYSLVYIGALDWIPNQKGLCWFLDNVWPMVKIYDSRLSLHVAGRNAPAWLKNRIQASNVNFYGEVMNAKEFLSKFQIQIVPLFSGSGVRIKILEGMAMGKVILTTSKGAEGIDITPGRELVIADDSDSFVLKIKDLVLDKSKRDSIGNEARTFISKEFDNLALANKVESFYRKLISV